VTQGMAAREGALIFNKEGKEVGKVTSGTHSPSLKKPIGMGYVDVPLNKVNANLF
jgi:aminomethyltransferase